MERAFELAATELRRACNQIAGRADSVGEPSASDAARRRGGSRLRRPFHIWVASEVDEALDLLTGLPAVADRAGTYPAGSLHRAVADRPGTVRRGAKSEHS